MTAMYAIYKNSYGELEGEESFILVADEAKVGVLIPLGPNQEEIDEIRQLVGSRVYAAKANNPEIDVEELLSSITYNMVIDVSISEPFATYEEAEQKAQEFMNVVNDFEEGPTYEVYEPIVPERMSEE